MKGLLVSRTQGPDSGTLRFPCNRDVAGCARPAEEDRCTQGEFPLSRRPRLAAISLRHPSGRGTVTAREAVLAPRQMGFRAGSGDAWDSREALRCLPHDASSPRIVDDTGGGGGWAQWPDAKC